MAVALEAEPLLTAVGIMVVAAYLALLAFRRFRLPDVLFLILLGVLLGPVLGFVEVDLFRTIGPLVGVVAIIIILFDGGLEMRISHLRSGAATGALLAVVVFSLTAAACAVVAHLLGGYSLVNASLLGMAFGGAGVVIVIPLIQHLGVRPESVTVVSIEAAVSDVLVIVGIYGLATAVAYAQTDPAVVLRGIVVTFSLGVVLGIAVGWLWARLLGRDLLAGYEYVLTLAALFLLYVGVEVLKGSGPIAVLVFGFVVGNSKRAGRLVAESRIGRARRAEKHPWERAAEESPPRPEKARRKGTLVPVFGEHLAGFHHEMVFLIRAFFFVGLGVTLDLAVFRSPRIVALGILLTGCVGLARYLGVKLLVRGERYPEWDRLAIALMFPLGLAAAALSQVPHQRFGLPGTEDFGSIAAVVIVLTNASTTFLVWLLSQPWAQKKNPAG